MNTNHLKKFAQNARRKLLQQVGAKLEYVLTHDTVELREKAKEIKTLQDELQRIGKAQLIEKVAYTWFNRLMALRFMDANDYQPAGIRIVSPKDGYTLPQLLDEAKQGGLVGGDWQPVIGKVNDLLDGKMPSRNPQNEAYRILLIAACNALHRQFPFLFERINDYTELLLPDDLTSEFSILQEVVEGMGAEDCQEVEIIGWLYQFYISEKKDEVFASKSKVKAEDIPAATQLFTPRWIVEYMVQNTVGKLWLQNKPNSKLREHMPYFIESPSVAAEDYLKITSVEEITLLDQACGSGHILVYGFELLSKIYEEEGYNPSEIPQLILKNNLYGFEIDERAAQLAGLALMMKARAYHRRVFRKELKPNILQYHDLALSADEVKDTFTQLGITLSDELQHDLNNMRQATNLGSLIRPHTPKQELQKVAEALAAKQRTADVFMGYRVQQLSSALAQLLLLANKYHCVVDNPPYMGGGNMNKPLADFVKANYPVSKADLMACFMEAGLQTLHPKGFLGMINQHSWMFLSSYEKLRERLIKETFFDTLLHLGPRTFPEIGGEVVQNASFTFWNTITEEKGAYIRLVDYDKSDLKKEKTLEAIQNPNCEWFYTSNQKDFGKIPGSPISYWASLIWQSIFKLPKVGELNNVKKGIDTGKNDRFLRYFHEVSKKDLSINGNLSKWYPYIKGGPFRKWYGNFELVVNWQNGGEEIRNHKSSTIRNQTYFFKPAITWSLITGSDFGARYVPEGCMFDNNGSSVFPEIRNISKLLPVLASKYARRALSIINPTLAFQVGDISRIPVDISNSELYQSLHEECLSISKTEWNSRETSWEFKQNELIRHKSQDLEETYDLYQAYWKNKFHQLQRNEEELNRQFIEIYGLQDELTPDVPLEDITILKAETKTENGQLVFQKDEVFQQFLSYAVGCMFGRYSLDQEGLILANQGETLAAYLSKVGKALNELSFIPDDDAIIPVLDDEWFEDDIVGRFYEFLKVTFGAADFEKNLAFVEECLGKDIRKYFVKDFYNDHIKRYKKRPIYWLFSSPKGSFNVLVYLHRYTPDTINNILNNYLREFIQKLKSQKQHLQHIQVSGSAAEQNKATKQIDMLDKMLLDCEEYERDILYPLATERIAIDLDDGVLVNYNKLGRAVKEVGGLNDKVTKKKVRAFDWIDVEAIRD